MALIDFSVGKETTIISVSYHIASVDNSEKSAWAAAGKRCERDGLALRTSAARADTLGFTDILSHRAPGSLEQHRSFCRGSYYTPRRSLARWFETTEKSRKNVAAGVDR